MAALTAPNNRSAAERRREFRELLRLIQFVAARGGAWQVGNAGFEVRLKLPVGTRTGTVVYKIHTVGWGERRVRLFASVTVWPPVRRGPISQTVAEQEFRRQCGHALH